MSAFVFEKYEFNSATASAIFSYRFDDGQRFSETITFSSGEVPDQSLFDRALFLAFILIGTSYFKTRPTPDVRFEMGAIDQWQADFLNTVYQEGLSQFAFENNLTRRHLAQFKPTVNQAPEPLTYSAKGVLALQSGGKDSLLTSVMLDKVGQAYTPWYLSNGQSHPEVLDTLGGQPLIITQRMIDREALAVAKENGALNGHVPVTYIVQSIALLQAIMSGKNTVLVSIAHEGEEPHATIDDLSVTHQWSKTWQAEQLFSEYVHRYISVDLTIGSSLRAWSELKVAKLFTEHAWEKFSHLFSSCNRANYLQGADNRQLRWCGQCPKCANSYLLFAPFVQADELKTLFDGQDLFEKPMLHETFKGLLGIDGVMKPFECVGEISELRYAYAAAQAKGEYGQLPFDVPAADFNPDIEYPHQDSLRLF